VKQQAQKEAGWMPEIKKMEALGRLSCKVAHDFNNILGVIDGYTTLVMSSVKENDPLTQDLREIRAAVVKAAAFTKHLLIFNGRLMLPKTRCGVNEIIADTLKRKELAPGGGFKIEPRLAPELPGIMAVAVQLEQVAANLLLNAREAMTGGGTAVISSLVLRLDGEAVRSPNRGEAGPLFIKISVQDSGTGISAEVFDRLFEPLFSTKGKGNGAGLGLSTVYDLVKQHNGWVEVQSAPGCGSEFSVFLPAINGQPEKFS